MRTPKSADETDYYHVREGNKLLVDKYAWLGIIFDEPQNIWINASDRTPILYSNFKPGVTRKENETCAAINLGLRDKHHLRHFPGYWYPFNCNNSEVVQWGSCEQSRNTSKLDF